MEVLTASITVFITFILSIPVTLWLQNILLKRRQKSRKAKLFQEQISVSNQEADKLKRHAGEFQEKEVLKVLDNIYVAIGYGLANCIMIEGEDGIVIIDTMESNDAALEVLKEFRKITEKPIRGIILTHFHADHTNGISVFLEDCGDNPPDIVTHDSFPKFLGQVMNVRSQITYKRAVRQFGTEIPDEVLKNAGIGMKLNLDKLQGFADVKPTKTFSKRLTLELAGLELEMIHAPGETDDQIIVWYPSKKVLFPADNIYKAFPNLYAIRGTMNRDTLQWVAALDTMLDLQPKYLVPQHTRPLEGRDNIVETVTAYRDAIQYVHDQTVRFMNKGLSGQEIAEIVQLPPHLRHHPYLIEYYGTVEWSVRSVFNGYIGWFSGKPADLHPLPLKEEAQEMLTLLGGRAKLEKDIRNVVEGGKYQLGLKLTDILANSGDGNDGAESLGSEMMELRSRCLQALAGREVSAPGMNWYLTEDMVMKGLEVKPSNESKVNRIKSGDIKSLFSMLTCMIDPEKTLDVRMVSNFNFTDTDIKLTVVIRQGVAMVRETEGDTVADMEVVTREKVWREVMAKERNALVANMSGELSVTPSITMLSTFFGYFDTEVV